MPKNLGAAYKISIHALREEGDAATLMLKARIENFYPRPPRGGRLSPAVHGRTASTFLSTPSARRATFYGGIVALYGFISIHALREEGDS